ncbi:MAG TPA: polyprenyl synthetase family protein [Ktedonobacterales bacterium]
MTAHETPIDRALSRYRERLLAGLRASLAQARLETQPAPAATALLDSFYGQIDYHFGWRHADLTPAAEKPGKLLRPTLLLLACELTAGEKSAHRVDQALPAALAVELVHNFSLVHDDIVDHDEERHGRPTLWTVWGASQGINTGDGLFTIARRELLRLSEHGVSPALTLELAILLDRTCLELCEGQFLDMEFEGHQTVTSAHYFEMIARKTASLISCAATMGGRLGAPDDLSVAARLAEFGLRLGLAFQVRDDMLGIWAAESLGKSNAGDVRRKKMSLPVIVALEHASPAAREALLSIYAAPGPATEAQITTVLSILDAVGAHERIRRELLTHCEAASQALAAVKGGAQDAREALAGLVAFVEVEAHA